MLSLSRQAHHIILYGALDWVWPGDHQTVDGRCAAVTSDLSPAWRKLILRSSGQHNHGLYPITTSAAPVFSDHDQRSTGFFRSQLARRQFFPIITGVASVFSDHHWRGATFFFDYSRLFTTCGRRFFSDHDQRGTRFFRSRPARHAFFPITTGAALSFSDRALRGADFFRSRVAQVSVFPMTRGKGAWRHCRLRAMGAVCVVSHQNQRKASLLRWCTRAFIHAFSPMRVGGA